MMSKKQLACMLTLHIIYLLLGASIFYHIESPLEMTQRAEEKLERIEIQNLLYENYIPSDPEKQDSILKKLSDYCGKSMFNYTAEEADPPIKWDFYHSFFFSYTVVSTIGYGNLAPTTPLSRILMIFYGLFGIPINGILLANLGEYFGLQLITVYRRYKRRDEKRGHRLDYFFHNLGMLGQIFLYLVPGFLFFIFLPSCLFVLFEGWDFVASIYFAFVTLTTIGFGDLVAGTVNNGFAYVYFVLYEIFLIVWITFGLGYIVMLLGFITSGMRSESVHKIEKKIATQLKTTQSRILHGFTRDIAVIRKLINEANLIKLKPIYVENAPHLYRSKSCPIFTFDVEPRGPIYRRKRANSENIQLSARDMLRIQSDTDLLGIDKERTFTASAIVKPAELLARVVNVLGGLDHPQEHRGIHMFDDEEILASEKLPTWSIGNDVIMTQTQRTRALSVAVPCYRKDSVSKLDSDFTWTNGDSADRYREAVNKRVKGKLSLPTANMTMVAPDEKQGDPKSIFTKLFQRQGSVENPTDYLKSSMKGRINAQAPVEKPTVRRGSIFPTFNFNQEESDIADQYKEKTKRGRHSIFPTFDFRDEEDEAAARAYRQKTKRHSIFPTFDFSESEDDVAKKYKEKTKRGRHSIFPTFDFSDPNESDDDDTIDEDEIRKYRNQTQRGRVSLFPTFGRSKKHSESKSDEDDTLDEKEVQKYKNMTQRGRLSMFPTFSRAKKHSESKTDEENDPVDEDEVKKYQNKTQRGRLSLFPSFGKSKMDNDVENDTIDEQEIAKYQSRTQKGRLSLFPSFGKTKKQKSDDEFGENSQAVNNSVKQTHTRRGSMFPSLDKDRKASNPGEDQSDLEASIKQYQNKTKRGRGSLFSGDIQDLNTNLPEDEQMQALEQTSVADLLRALAILEASSPTNSGNTSSLLSALVTGSNPTSPVTKRRGSVHPDFKLAELPNFNSKSDTEESASPRRRRVSARAAVPQFTPTLATVVAGAELQTTATAARENRMNKVTLPINSESSEEEPQPARVRRFSPAPMVPGRQGTGPVSRLFSRVRKESVSSIEEEKDINSRRGSLTDVVVDNNKDKT